MGLLRNLLPADGFVRRWYSATKADIAAWRYRNPGKSYTVIAVTGTDGKTTTSEMIAHILRSQGKKVISASSSKIAYGSDRVYTSKRSTPSPFLLQRLLREGIEDGYQYLVLETTSHALRQRRNAGILADVTVLTNITSEHLDYHKTVERYRAAKELLFTRDSKSDAHAIMPIGDESTDKMIELYAGTSRMVTTYGQIHQQPRPQYSVSTSQRREHGGQELKIYPGDMIGFLPMYGDYNARNALAAVLAAHEVGIQLRTALLSLANFPGVPGRLQAIEAGQPAKVFVDYAISYAAYEEALKTLRQIAGNGKLMVVFGSYGNQPDPLKRAKIGALVAKMADVLIVTDEEPYYEDPAQIREHILSGVREQLTPAQMERSAHEIPDRESALRYALMAAGSGDVVVAFGMGSLTSRNIGGKEIAWNEAEVIKKIIQG